MLEYNIKSTYNKLALFLLYIQMLPTVATKGTVKGQMRQDFSHLETKDRKKNIPIGEHPVCFLSIKFYIVFGIAFETAFSESSFSIRTLEEALNV